MRAISRGQHGSHAPRRGRDAEVYDALELVSRKVHNPGGVVRGQPGLRGKIVLWRWRRWHLATRRLFLDLFALGLGRLRDRHLRSICAGCRELVLGNRGYWRAQRGVFGFLRFRSQIALALPGL